MTDIGKFKTIREVGRGHFGIVYHVNDSYLKAERALKVINARIPSDFVKAINEAEILNKCRHKHIVDIKEVDVYDVNGTPFPCITTEYLVNGSVQNYLQSHFISVHKSINIISQALYGLEHAHNQGIYHRDIKPGNLLFSDNWEAKLSDFGLAYGLASQPINFYGYYPHLAPEVLSNTVQDDISDLYAMGITFYRIINNLKDLIPPFNDVATLLKATEKEKFPQRVYAPYIPELLQKIVNKSIRANRDKRYQTCIQFRQAIQKIPLCIEWIKINKDYWEGSYAGNTYSLYFYSKRTGYFIDFKKNNKNVNTYCYERIPNEVDARNEFYSILRKTTLKI